MSQPFIHLRARSAYSLLQSALQVKTLTKLAAKHEMPALGLTDSNNLFGALEFSDAAAGAGVQPIIGCALEVRGETGVGGVLALLAQNEAGYANLMQLSSAAYIDTVGQGEPHVPLAQALAQAQGLIALTGAGDGPLAHLLALGRVEEGEALLAQLAGAFPNRLYVELQRHGARIEADTEGALVDLAYKLGLPLVATNDVRFQAAKDHGAHDALMCIAASSYLGEEDRPRVSAEHYFKSAAEMASRFSDLPEAIDNTIEIARRCAFRVEKRAPILPRFDTKKGRDEPAELKAQAEAGLKARLKALGDMRAAPVEEYEKRLAREESYVQVRSQLASTAKRLPASVAAGIIAGLVTHDEDAGDPHLPLLVWWAIEAHCGSDRESMIALLADSSTWNRPIVAGTVLSRLMQRFALEAILATDDPARREACFAACLKLFQTAPSAVHRQSLADGFLEAFAGRDLGQVPAELAKALSEASSQGSDLTVGIKLGDAKAIAEALKVVASDKSPVSSRLVLIESLGATPRPAAAPVLLKLLGSPSVPIKRAALLALMQYDEAAIGKEVCNRWHSTLPNEFDLRSIALRLLASRVVWSKSLVAEVAGSRIKPTEVPLDIVQQMRLHQDAELDQSLDRYWGKTRATSEEKKQQIDRLTRLVKLGGSQSAAGDAKLGKAIFVKNCGTCHTLFGEGGQTGPNLTGYDREKLDFLAVAVVDPSAAIREEFTQFGIAMKDGRVLTGLVDKETPTTVSIRGANNQATLLNRDEIDEKQALRNSIMPDGLLDKLNDAEIRDLFAYVMSKTPVK